MIGTSARISSSEKMARALDTKANPIGLSTCPTTFSK